MIPLRDRAKSKRIPLITVLLIIVNTYVFVNEMFLGPALKGVVYRFAVIPSIYLLSDAWTGLGIVTNSTRLVTALFLHASPIHLIGNMWYLWIFGDNVEDKLGHFNFLIFF